MKLLRLIIVPLVVITLVIPAGILVTPRTASADAFDTACPAGGTCGIPRPGAGSVGGGGGAGLGSSAANALGGSLQAFKGPVATTPGWGNYKVDITNQYVGVGSPVLNALLGNAAAQTAQQAFEWTQTFVLEALKKRILDMMVAEIIRWIQGGDEPRFVTDWQGFLQEAGQIAAGDFAQELGAGFLCEPFSQQLQLVLAPPVGGDSSYRNSATCTLDDIVGNVNDFYDNFSSGGWLAYEEAWQPQNNVFGSYVMARDEKQHRIFLAQQAAQNEATVGGGFLSPKACRESIGGTGPDLDKDGIKGDVAASCDIVTPGSVVEELTKRAVTADIDFVINANQLSTYLAAIADAAFNRLIRDGVGGLKGLSTDDAPDGGFIPDGRSNCVAFAVGSPLRDACESYTQSNNDNFDIARSRVLADIAQAKTQYLLAKTATENSINASAALLLKLREKLQNSSTRCTSQAEVDKVTAKIVELQGNVTLLNTIITGLDAAVIAINATALNDWAALTRAIVPVQDDINFIAASDVANYATEQNQNILAEIEIIENRLLTCF